MGNLIVYLRKVKHTPRLLAIYLIQLHVTLLLIKRLGYLESMQNVGDWAMDFVFADNLTFEVSMEVVSFGQY